jgi:hypothetical protein
MRAGCWATELGDCAGKLSGEHIVSESLWSGPSVFASGGPWGEGREIGVASLTAKILCQRHNSRLSAVDTAGARAFATIRQSFALAEARKLISPRPWLPFCYSIDGPLLERWFLKTAINATLLLHRPPTWAANGLQGNPPLLLVEMAFGLLEIEKPFGLYTVATVGETIESQDRVSCHPLGSVNGQLSGALFEFRGFTFLLNMRRQLPEDVRAAQPDGRVLRTGEELFYRLNRVNKDVAGLRSHFLDFEWPGQNQRHFAS